MPFDIEIEINYDSHLTIYGIFMAIIFCQLKKN
jgi:hypothetical protein